MTRPSSLVSTTTPSSPKAAPSSWILSVSFTRSSLASRTTVLPFALAATTARMGISSIRRGIIPPATVTPRSSVPSTTTSATGSPQTSRSFSSSTVAPIARSTSKKPVRVGFTPTFSTLSMLPGEQAATAMGNAAEDRSPGMAMCRPRGSSVTGPMATHPSPLAMGMPK